MSYAYLKRSYTDNNGDEGMDVTSMSMLQCYLNYINNESNVGISTSENSFGKSVLGQTYVNCTVDNYADTESCMQSMIATGLSSRTRRTCPGAKSLSTKSGTTRNSAATS